MLHLEVLPPSPPTTSSRTRKHLLIPSELSSTSDPDVSLASVPSSSAGQTRKRVGFSTYTNVQAAAPSTGQSTTIKALPASRDCLASTKSILKQSEGPENGIPRFDGGNDESFSLLQELENTGLQLESGEKTVRVDAYLNLARALKAYDEFPDVLDTRAKVATIIKCIRRDVLVSTDGILQPADTNLITSALKVAVILIWNRQSSSHMSDDFRLFLIDRAVQVVSEHKAPKSVIMHYLHLLATQDFRPGFISSNSRALRLLESLRTLTDHVKGNGVVTERLLVYQKLLDQARPLMKSKASLWMPEILSSMVSNVKDIRLKGTSLGMRVCTIFPSSPAVSIATRTALDDELEEKKSLNTVMTRKLEKMITLKEEAVHVPQIWAVVILLCNSTESRIDEWNGLKEWLRVIQRCFNCGESSIRIQANLAWNRFVFAARPHEASEQFASLLGKPVLAQLEKKNTENSVKQLSNTAISSYCNLLYYAFRPAATHKQYSRMWNEYVVKVMKSSFLDSSKANSDFACRVLMALLSNAQGNTRVWKEYRAHENTSVEPEELPVLDCKWVRSKAQAICTIFDLLFRYCSWGPSRSLDQSFIATAWKHFLRAVRESSSKEIKPSVETKQAIAAVMQLLIRQSSEVEKSHYGPGIDGISADTLKHAFEIAIDEIGMSAMVEFLEHHHDPSGLVFYDYSLALLSGAMNQESPRHTSLSNLQLYNRLLQSLNDVSLELLNHHQWSTLPLTLVARALSKGTQAMSSLKSLASFLEQLFKTPLPVEVLAVDKGIYRQLHRDFDTIINALGKLAPDAITTYDSLFATIFTCPHRSNVNRMVATWNSTYGQKPHLEYGPKLLDVFRELRAHVTLELPGIPFDMEDTHPRVTPLYLDTQHDILERHTYDLPATSTKGQGLQHASPLRTERTKKQTAVSATALTREVTCESRNAVQRVGRHDDSQVQFVPIDSSPLAVGDRDSQTLTTRQKEVRDRQREGLDFAFADLKSTPITSKTVHSAECSIGRKAVALADRPSTPTLPDQQEAEDAELPSPTPRARHYALTVDDIVPPSSSPLGAEDVAKISSRYEDQKLTGTSAAKLTSPAAVAHQVETEIGEVQELGELEDELPVEPLVAPHDASREAYEAPKGVSTADVVDIAGEQPEKSIAMKVTAAVIPNHKIRASHQDELANDDDLPLHSDELELMTASQLSNELNLSFADTEIARESEGEAKLDTSKKKRKRAGYGGQSSKRRRRISTQSQRPEPSVEIEDNEIWDTIVVDTSPESSMQEDDEECSQRGSVLESQTKPVTSQKRRRGRPRRSRKSTEQANEPVIKVEDEATPPKVDMEDLPSAEGSTEYDTAREVQAADFINNTTDNVEDRNTDVSSELNTTSEQTDEDANDVVTEVTATATVVAAVPTRINVLDSLQGVLDRLKSKEDMEGIDLRAIDELCFQIRFHAQAMANGT